MAHIRGFLFFLIVMANACQENPVSIRPDLAFSLGSPQDTVTVFADGIVSTGMNERDMAISADGKEIFFTLGGYNQKRRAIVHICQKDDVWAAPEILSWSGIHNDIEPFLSPDGHSLYFASTRPIFGDSTRKDYNIWVSMKLGELWQEPLPLDTIINSKSHEYYPAAGKSGNLYFTAAYKNGLGKEDIYMSLKTEEKYMSPTPLDSNINSATNEFNAYVSPGEDTILFSSYGRTDDMGGGDLYMSIKDKEGRWQKARNLGPSINSTSLDYCPYIDPSRKVFYFTSNRGEDSPGRIDKISIFKDAANKTLNGLDNIYYVKVSALDITSIK